MQTRCGVTVTLKDPLARLRTRWTGVREPGPDLRYTIWGKSLLKLGYESGHHELR